ncbi:MAG: putative enzyme involved in pigment biosynthesi [Erysipelotrichaceae bacterium]|nr:MAG: putative enzyme involved in pigment biosynthesi [Erysipelotrichaceae bacterium]
MLKINQEIKDALSQGKAVVALESTIISHGMPYPQNVQTALEVEAEIRANGAIPATIGIIDGIMVVGMSPDEIEAFGKRHDIVKVSRRDLPMVIANKAWGATTVASTMIIAALSKIEVFVTGGIGGVHRGAQATFDISADLQELAHTNVTVVCAGAKAILDLPLTMEYLETFGVPVLGYQSDELAALYTPKSNLKVDQRVNTAQEIAKIIRVKRDLKLDGGVLISNPIPAAFAMDEQVITQAIDQALKESHLENISGKDVTPYLLAKVKALTGGDSLESNIALIKNNARVGAQIAVALSKGVQDVR